MFGLIKQISFGQEDRYNADIFIAFLFRFLQGFFKRHSFRSVSGRLIGKDFPDWKT